VHGFSSVEDPENQGPRVTRPRRGPEGNWPEGLLTHSAGLNEAGHLVVIEVWDTPEHQARFMEERLGEALAKGGITSPPSRVTWIELVAHNRPGG
jgi:hypothetical protein